jgi:hypothetical protein
MNNKKKWIAILLGIGLSAAAQAAVAETAVVETTVIETAVFETAIDLRVKLGSAAGVGSIDVMNIGQTSVAQSSSNNFQIEAACTFRQNTMVNFVGTAGFFSRSHKGRVQGLPTDVDYVASGLSGSAGASMAISDNLNVEVRAELAFGPGKPALTTPNFAWNTTRKGPYEATSIILGGYYTFSKPDIQIGLELGGQSFEGAFQIWNDAGYWSDSNVKGRGVTGNLVVGYRF